MSDKIKLIKTETLSENWAILKKITFDYLRKEGNWQTQVREVYNRGNGTVILLYNKKNKTIILTRQFRLPTFLNGNPTGMMIEACAGTLEDSSPEECIRRETQEETGYKIDNLERIMELYMSPGSVTEIIYFYIAEYSEEMKISEGGGIVSEQEEIEVMELSLDQALTMVDKGEIKDAKTIILLQYAKLKNLV